MMETDAKKLRWATKVSQSLVRKFYETESRGIVDEELIDDVGYALYARCLSILKVTEAVKGRVECPSCQRTIHRETSDSEIKCECGWKITWNDFRKSYKDRQLFGGAALPCFQTFVDSFLAAGTPREKLLLIDRLIHEFHWNITHKDPEAKPTRAAAVNLIEGKSMADVIQFLNSLSAPSDEQINMIHEQWRSNIDSNLSH